MVPWVIPRNHDKRHRQGHIMTKTEFIQWLQETKFAISQHLDGETETEAYDYTDDEGREHFKPVCLAYMWNTAEATLPDGTPFEVSYQVGVERPGPSGRRYGDYNVSPADEEIVWDTPRPAITEDDDPYEDLGRREIDELVRDNIPSFTDMPEHLIPNEVTTGIDIDKESDMETITVTRDNDSDIRFTGEEIASASSHSPYDCSGRWTVLKLYRTKGGKYVCSEVGRTQWQGESDRYSGTVCETPAEVIKYFGHGRLAKEIYDEAGFEDVVEVE